MTTFHRILITAGCVGVLALSPVLGCSSDGDGSSSTTTGVGAPSSTTTTSAPPAEPGTTSTLSPGTTVADTDTVPVPETLAPEQTLSLSVYWTRSYGEPMPIDIPAHRDPAGGPYPFVLYGALSNNLSTPVDGPTVEVAWVDGSGATRATTPGRMVAADGTDLRQLAPGASTDFIVVVADEATATLLVDLQPMVAGGAA